MAKRKRKSKKIQRSPEWKKAIRLNGDLKAVRRLRKFVENLEATESCTEMGREIMMDYLRMLGGRIAHEMLKVLEPLKASIKSMEGLS